MRIICLLILFLQHYSGVKGQNYINPTGKEYPVMAWYTVDATHNTREFYKQMAQAGFNLSLSANLTKTETQQALIQAKGTGVKIVLNCHEARNADKNFIRKIKNAEALGMYYLADEPSAESFRNLKVKVARVRENDIVHTPYINLLPIYADTTRLKAASYEDYIKRFLNDVNAPILSFDHYPFVRDTYRRDYFENLRVVSRLCKNAGVPFWGFVRTLYNKNYYAVDEGRLRYQIFSNMAYGAQGIQYFTYAVPQGGNSAILDSLYNKTKLYGVVTRINREIQVLGKNCLGAELKNVCHFEKKSDKQGLPTCIDRIEIKGKGVIVSLFEKEGTEFLIIVNEDYEKSQNVIISTKVQAAALNKKGRYSRLKKYHVIDITAGNWFLLRLN